MAAPQVPIFINPQFHYTVSWHGEFKGVLFTVKEREQLAFVDLLEFWVMTWKNLNFVMWENWGF